MHKEMFFEEMKNFFLELSSSSNPHLTFLESCGYLETLKSHTDELTYLFNEMDHARMEFQFQGDITGGYTNGTIHLHFVSLNENAPSPKHRYEFELTTDQRYFGYCQCKPEDEGFNSMHNCCGTNCDWGAPEIHISKVEVKPSILFKGLEKDLWLLEDLWLTDASEIDQVRKNEQVRKIDAEIERLTEQKNKLLN